MAPLQWNFQNQSKGTSGWDKGDSKLNKGKYIWRNKAGATAYQWKDTKDIPFISNDHDTSDAAEVEKIASTGKKEIKWLAVVRAYNSWMCGVDTFYQRKNLYPLDRRSKRWWPEYFTFTGCCHSVFNLVGSWLRKNRASFVALRKRGSKNWRTINGLPGELRFLGNDDYAQETSSRKTCRLCSPNDKEKRTRFQGHVCNVTLCIRYFGPFQRPT